MKPRNFFLVIAFAAAAVLAGSLQGAVLRVPEQYPTIQQAVAAAVPYDEIEIAAGTYLGQVVIDSKWYLTLRGVGRPVIDAGAIGSAAILVQGLSFEVILEGLVVRGANKGIHVDGAGKTEIRDCTVRDSANTGILFQNAPRGLVARTSVLGTGSYGITVLGGCQQIVLSENRISGTTWAGISLAGTGMLASENRVEAAAGSTIVVAGSQHVIAANDLKGGGIVLGGAGHVVDQNRVTGSLGNGIELAASSSVLRGNTIKKSALAGISLRYGAASSNLLVGNDVKRSGWNGVELLTGAQSNTLADNRARKSGNVDLLTSGSNYFMMNEFATSSP